MVVLARVIFEKSVTNFVVFLQTLFLQRKFIPTFLLAAGGAACGDSPHPSG